MKLSQNKIGLLILLIFLFAAVWNTCSQTVLCPEGRNQTGISVERVGMRGSFALSSQEGKVALDTITFYLEENNVRMRSHALFTVGLTNKVMAEMYLSNDTSFQIVYERRKERQEKSLFTREYVESTMFVKKRGNNFYCARKEIPTGELSKEYWYPLITGFLILVFFVVGVIAFIRSSIKFGYESLDWTFFAPFYVITLVAIFFAWPLGSTLVSYLLFSSLIGLPLLAYLLHKCVFEPLTKKKS